MFVNCPAQSPNRVRLEVTELDRRDVLAPPGSTYNWPVAVPAGTMPELLNVYGNFQQVVYLHFHEGVDAVAAAETPVKAIDGRTVFGVDSAAPVVSNRSMSVNRVNAGSPPEGWNYIHMQPGVNAAGMPYGVGMAVAAGDQSLSKMGVSGSLSG